MRKLREYQLVGAQFLCERPGAILGDGVGLGKTAQAIYAACQRGKNVLVISPKVLKSWWCQEIKSVLEEPDAVMKSPLQDTPELLAGGIRWVIAHYEQFNDRSRVRDWFYQQPWDIVIVDEVHNIAKPSQRSRGIAMLKSTYRWGLTGTPLRDRPQDLHGLLRWVAPQKFRNKWAWIAAYFLVHVNRWGGWEVKELYNPIGFYKSVSPYLLVRGWEDVQLEMPAEPIVQRVPLIMDEAQARLYRDLENRMLVEIVTDAGEPAFVFVRSAIARFTYLHRAASFPQDARTDGVKIAWLKEYLAGGNPPAVILTRYKDTVRAVTKVINASEHPERDSFIVGTYAAYSHGHNLQHLHVLVLWDSTYSRLEHEQAIGRVYRQGQREQVIVYELECVNTVDRHMFDVIREKESMVAAVIRWLRERNYEEIARKCEDSAKGFRETSLPSEGASTTP
jgi:SNF2 family DNA or RNA helicase